MPGKLVIHSLRWVGDRSLQPDETPDDDSVLYHAVVFLDDQRMDQIVGVKLNSEGGGFTTAELTIAPSSVEYIWHDQATWNELNDE